MNPSSKTEFFVVCGGSNPKEDVWQFADFFAILRELEINFDYTGTTTAWNMFPYEEYFKTYSLDKHKDEVWFGYKHPGFRVDPAFHFKKGDPTPWKDWDKDSTPNMDKKILQHIEQRSLKAGDRFNFIFIGHSYEEGDFEVGNQKLFRKDLAKSFKRFSPDVQVNIIVASCWSGKLVNQMRDLGSKGQYVQSSTTADLMSYFYGRRTVSDPLRGSPFIASIIESMHGWVGEKSKAPRTLGEHIEHVRKRGIWFHEPKSIPQAFTNVDLHVAVVQVLFAHYVHLKPSDSKGRKTAMVIDPGYPAPNSTYGPTFQPQQAPAAANRALELVKKEMALVKNNSNPGHPRDLGFGTLLQVAESSSKSVKERMHHLIIMLDGLKWRFQMQERLILIWDELVNYEVLSTECIMRRMELEAAMKSDPVRILARALRLFEYAQDFSDSARGTIEKFPKDTIRGKFQEPTYWLATLLLRCDTDNVPGVVSWLRKSRLLGGIAADAEVQDLEGIEKLEKDSTYLLCPDVTPRANDLRSCRIGFILPHGENIQTWARATSIRYANLRNVYRELCGQRSWDMDENFRGALEEMNQWVPSDYETVLKSKAEESK